MRVHGITAGVLGWLVLVGGCGEGGDTGLPMSRELVFADVSEQAGLPLAGLTSGAVFVDLDGDGVRDLLVGRHDRVPEAYRNLGGMRFARMHAWSAGMDVYDHHATLADDIDSDGQLDFYFVAGAHRGEGLGPNALYLGGQDTWRDEAERWQVADRYGRGRGALLLDPDRDGRPNLFVLNWRTAPRSFEFGEHPPVRDTIERELGIAAAADEAVLAGEGRQRREFSHHLVPIDLQHDGQTDFLAFGGALPLKLLRRGPAGIEVAIQALPPQVYLPVPRDAAWGDFDGDLEPDLVLVYDGVDELSHIDHPWHNRLLVWREGTFVDRTPAGLKLAGGGVLCVAADLDNDGALDLVIAQADRTAGTTTLRVLLGRGDGDFVPVTWSADLDRPLRGQPDGLLVEDLDGDGALDLVVLLGDIPHDTPGGGVRVLRNAGPVGDWLALEFGADQALLPYGAVVTVTAGGHVQRRQYWPTQVRGSAYRGGLHVGLGSAEAASRVEIAWPSGAVTRLRDVAAGTVLTVRDRGPGAVD